MALPRLDLPDDQLTLLYRDLITLLQADATLSKVVKTWRVWEGDPDDAQPPTSSEMPWVRITPMTSPLKLAEERAYGGVVTFKYELATAGTRVDDLMNLFGAFRRALNFDAPVLSTVALQFLRVDQSGSLRAVAYEFADAAIGAQRAAAPPPAEGQPAPPPPTNMVSAGTFKVSVLIPC